MHPVPRKVWDSSRLALALCKNIFILELQTTKEDCDPIIIIDQSVQMALAIADS